MIEESKATPTQAALDRQDAKKEAGLYGIDTKGMSTREIKGAVNEARQAEEDMSRFIERSLNNLLSRKNDVSPNDNGAIITNNRSDDRIAMAISDKPKVNRGSTGTGSSNNGGGGGDFPPAGWTTVTLAVCKDNNPAEVTVIAVDPFYEP